MFTSGQQYEILHTILYDLYTLQFKNFDESNLRFWFFYNFLQYSKWLQSKIWKICFTIAHELFHVLGLLYLFWGFYIWTYSTFTSAIFKYVCRQH